MFVGFEALPKFVLSPVSQEWFINYYYCCYFSSCGLTLLPFPPVLFAWWFLLPVLLWQPVLFC